MKYLKLFSLFSGGILLCIPQIYAQQPKLTPLPSTSIQIVNATSVPSISLEVNGRLDYPDFPQGEYTGNAFTQGLAYRYKGINKADGVSADPKVITFKNLDNQTLLLIGDFSVETEEGAMPQPNQLHNAYESPSASNPPNLIFRVYSHQEGLKKPPLQIRIINGMPRKILKLKLPNSATTLDFLPGEEKELVGQPPVQRYDFEVDGKHMPVIMLQDENPVNANIVFYLKNNEPAFKRFFESTRRPEPDDYSNTSKGTGALGI